MECFLWSLCGLKLAEMKLKYWEPGNGKSPGPWDSIGAPIYSHMLDPLTFQFKSQKISCLLLLFLEPAWFGICLQLKKVWWRNHSSVLLDYETTLEENITEHSAVFSSSLSHFASSRPFTKALVMPPPLAWCYNQWWHFEVYTLLFLFLLRSLNICYFPVFGCFLWFSLMTLRSETQMEYKSGRFVMIRLRYLAMSSQRRYF